MKRTLMMGTVGLLAGALLAFLLVLGFQLVGGLSRSAEPTGSVQVKGREMFAASADREEAEYVMAPTAGAPGAPPPAPVAMAQESSAPEGGAFGGMNAKGAPRGRLARGDPEEAPAAGSAPSRAWFPETFLFEPLVVTDASGAATVPVRVPDRLTGWRVLALAHSRSGAQAGAVARFSGTLPTYVDPVLPPFLRAGDAARLPVQVVNTTDAAVEVPLKVEARGATVEGGSRTVRVPARGSVVEYVLVKAAGPGAVSVRATLGASDAVVRDFQVWPTGKPVVSQLGSTLAEPRTFTLKGATDAQAGSERVRLLVYPGALGVLRSEWATAGGRGSPEDVAYALMLVGRSPELLTALGETQASEALKALISGTRRVASPPQPVEGALDVEPMRKLLAQATQRALREGRSPDVSTAALLAEGALLHPDNVVLSRLGERLAAQVARAQSPDGTCQGGEGWTLQRLLVATADCMRVVNAAAGTPEGKRRAAFFAARALGAVERNRAHIKDGYTAAALLASGAVSGSLKDELRAQVRDAVKKIGSVPAYLSVEPGVVDGSGQTPSMAEATALAVLALDGDPKAPMADLGAFILSMYDPARRGWGGGRANRLALRAVVALFREPLPARVRVVLERDGQVLTEGTYDAKALREVLALEAAAPGSGGEHTWTVRAEPAVPGLGFSMTLAAAVPWKPEAPGGLQLVVKGPSEAKVGQPVEVVLEASTPSNLMLELRHELPAGVQVDSASLDALVSDGRVLSWDAEDGAVTLRLPPRGPGEPFQARFRAIPTLAGTLQGGVSSLRVSGRPDLVSYVPPTIWAVR